MYISFKIVFIFILEKALTLYIIKNNLFLFLFEKNIFEGFLLNNKNLFGRIKNKIAFKSLYHYLVVVL